MTVSAQSSELWTCPRCGARKARGGVDFGAPPVCTWKHDAVEMEQATAGAFPEMLSRRRAKVRGRRVLRQRPDGSFDWATVHLTKRGARQAAALYERTGQIRGRLA